MSTMFTLLSLIFLWKSQSSPNWHINFFLMWSVMAKSKMKPNSWETPSFGWHPGINKFTSYTSHIWTKMVKMVTMVIIKHQHVIHHVVWIASVHILSCCSVSWTGLRFGIFLFFWSSNWLTEVSVRKTCEVCLYCKLWIRVGPFSFV